MNTHTMEIFYKPLDDAGRYLPEGPKLIETANGQFLWWVNVQHGEDELAGSLECLRIGRDDISKRFSMPGRPGFLFPTNNPEILLVGLETSLQLFNVITSTITPFVQFPCDPSISIVNDAALLPGGRALIVGTKEVTNQKPLGALYLVTLNDRLVSTLATQQTCSNGKVVIGSGDSYLLFDIDSPTKKVTRYELDVTHRMLRDMGCALNLSNVSGVPDGMVDCGDGSVIIAFYDTKADDGKVRRYFLDDGSLVDEWTVPDSPRVTCPVILNYGKGTQVMVTTALEGRFLKERTKKHGGGNLFVGQVNLDKCFAIPRAVI